MLSPENQPGGKRDQAWRDAQDIEHGERYAKQEYDCNFQTSGDTVITSDIIDYYEKTWASEPIHRLGVLHDTWIWKDPEPGHEYAVIVDTGRGDGADYSTMQVIDLVLNEQVAEYRGQPDTDAFPAMIMKMGYDYNEALVTIERESYGWGIVKDVLAERYPNLYWSPKEGMVMDAETYLARNYDYDRSKMVPGFSTNVKFRPLVVGSFLNLIEKKALIIHSKRSIDEWKTFIWGENGKGKAQKGYNDDLTIPLGIYGFLRDTALRFSKHSQDISKMALDHWIVKRGATTHKNDQFIAKPIDNSPVEGAPIVKPRNNPYIMKVNGRDEDISWLVLALLFKYLYTD